MGSGDADAIELGYTLACEEHGPRELVGFARRAEEAGFAFAMISDHFHPWTERQGHSPHVWSVIGGVAVATERLRVGTAVTCPTVRQHPAIVAQAAATCQAMLDGRFTLGVGTGEALNEHILGGSWPSAAVRREMLEEAVAVIRELWGGGLVEHRGRHYTVENARLYTLPDEPPPIVVAAAGPEAATLAGRIGDGFCGTAPDGDLLARFAEAGGSGPRYGQITICWAESDAEARRTALEWWPNAGLPGELGQVLPQPAHFEQAAQLVTEEQIARSIACGPDSEVHLDFIRRFADAGYDHVFVHQVGPDQEGFMRFYEREVLPHARALTASARP
ncbi:MAG: TIGR03557 family F420-dependent LLM class oxidoreductase [Actinobacteria bacterium]|nr:TIGR03557 family F420-dependent LLM class oxidoreductase [Actinomycetota bacterium]